MDLATADMLGHVGYAFLFLGMILLARQHMLGWLFRLSGEAIWVVIGIGLSLTSVWFWGSIFMCIDAYGYWKWRKNEQTTT
jgi:hypothetical protein